MWPLMIKTHKLKYINQRSNNYSVYKAGLGQIVRYIIIFTE